MSSPPTRRHGPAAPQPPGSPCIGICRIDPARALCEGCLRTLDEIAVWSQLNEAERRAVWALLPARQAPASDPGVTRGQPPYRTS